MVNNETISPNKCLNLEILVEVAISCLNKFKTNVLLLNTFSKSKRRAHKLWEKSVWHRIPLFDLLCETRTVVQGTHVPWQSKTTLWWGNIINGRRESWRSALQKEDNCPMVPLTCDCGGPCCLHRVGLLGERLDAERFRETDKNTLHTRRTH